MRYNIGEEFEMKQNYNRLVEGETVKIVNRKKTGKDTYLTVCNCKGVCFENISFKLLKRKKC